MNNEQLAAFTQRPPMELPEIYKPDTKDTGVTGFCAVGALPSFLTQEEPQLPEGIKSLKDFIEEFDYTTLKRLTQPFVTAKGYELLETVATTLKTLNEAYRNNTGKSKCFRCGNTGVTGWAAHGAVAKVCQCVRLAAAQGPDEVVTEEAPA